MWTSTRVERTGPDRKIMVNKHCLEMLVNGYCRKQSQALTGIILIIAQDVINICYTYSKQMWTHLGGKSFELFDLLYFTMFLPEKMVRTYLRQIIEEIERNANIAVLEPNDLLLDETFSLFIVNQVNKTKVKTYTAPELLQEQYSISPPLTLSRQESNPKYLKTVQWSHKCVIFSIGVILFILLLGVIPFEIALPSDPWYKMLLDGKYKKFWKMFRGFRLSEDVRNMLQRMLCPLENRMDIHEIKKCAFYQGDIYTNSDAIIARFKYQYNKKEEKRRQMIVSNYKNIYKVTEDLNINKIFDIDTCCEMFPDDEIEGILDTYCSNIEYKKIYYCIAQVIEEKYDGLTEFDKEKQSLICLTETKHDKIKFGVKVYQSKRWKIAHRDEDFEFDIEDYKPLYVVRFYRIEGDSFAFLKIKNLGLLVCADVMSGLTQIQRRAFRNFYACMIKRKKLDNVDEGVTVSEVPRAYFEHDDKIRYFWF